MNRARASRSRETIAAVDPVADRVNRLGDLTARDAVVENLVEQMLDECVDTRLAVGVDDHEVTTTPGLGPLDRKARAGLDQDGPECLAIDPRKTRDPAQQRRCLPRCAQSIGHRIVAWAVDGVRDPASVLGRENITATCHGKPLVLRRVWLLEAVSPSERWSRGRAASKGGGERGGALGCRARVEVPARGGQLRVPHGVLDAHQVNAAGDEQ